MSKGAKNPPRGALAEGIRILDLATRVALSCGLGFVGGFWLDGQLGWRDGFPVCTLLGSFLGLAAGLLALVRGLSQSDAADQKSEQDQAGPVDESSSSRLRSEDED